MRVEPQILEPRLRAAQNFRERGNGPEERAEVVRAIATVMQVDEALVEDHADAGLAVAERNDPDPVAVARVVIGAEAPRADVAAGDAETDGEIVDVADVLP